MQNLSNRKFEFDPSKSFQEILDNQTKDFEHILIAKALQHTGGRRIEAAHRLGIGRNTLTRKIQALGIDG